MLRLNSKRGFLQVDSIVSMSLFFLFVIWLFIFVRNYEVSRPYSFPPSLSDLDSLEWTLNKLFIAVDSSTNDSFPVMVKLPSFLNFSQNHTILLGNEGSIPFIINNNLLVFLDDSTYKNYYYLINSKRKYSSLVFEQVVGNTTYLSTQSVRSELDNSLPVSIISSKGVAVFNSSFKLNNAPLSFENSSIVNLPYLSSVKSSGYNIDNSCYTFGGHNWLACAITSPKDIPHFLSVKFYLANFSEFYSDDSHSSKLNVSIDSCYNFSTSHILFVDKSKGVSFEMIFSPSNVSICSENNLLYVQLNSFFNTQFKYLFYMNYSDLLKPNFKFPDYNVRFGSLRVLSGIDPNKVANESTLESWLKNYSSGSENFGVSVFYNGTLISVGNSSTNNDVYSKTYYLPLLLDNGSFSSLSFTLRSWRS